MDHLEFYLDHLLVIMTLLLITFIGPIAKRKRPE